MNKVYRKLKAPHSKDYLRNKRTIIGALEQFDDFGRMPDGRSRHTLFERGSYHLLCSEFRELIDFTVYMRKRGKKESTIRGEALNTASFLHQMQQRGAQCLDAIMEEDVLSFFLVEGGSLQRSCSYKKNIAAVFKAGLNWKAAQCRKVLSFLPVLRENRKISSILRRMRSGFYGKQQKKAKFLHVIGRFSSCSFYGASGL